MTLTIALKIMQTIMIVLGCLLIIGVIVTFPLRKKYPVLKSKKCIRIICILAVYAVALIVVGIFYGNYCIENIGPKYF
ncbi:MAG: hypothetical protein ACI4W1_07445 [Ruminococcus sp.]